MAVRASPRRGLLAVCIALGAVAMASLSLQAFVAGSWRSASARGAIAARAEETPPPKESTALVKVSEESAATTASLLGGLAGLWFGGPLIGAGLFVATTILTRGDKDSDVAQALKGISSKGLEALNWGVSLDDKYQVTSGVGNAINDAIEKAKEKPETKEVAGTVSSVLKGAGDAISSVDQDIGIKDTVGSLATAATDLTYTATEKVSELNDKYKVTDKIKAKIDEVASSAKSS